jgi:hypothetical protein
MRRIGRFVALLVWAGAASACELTEVAAPDSAEILVVEAVLRVGAPTQYVLLHRSLEGRIVRGAPGARVRVVDAEGGSVDFIPAPTGECLMPPIADGEREIDVEVHASCYRSPPIAGRFVHPGRSYSLFVTTADGLEARGRTHVPGAFAFRNPAAPLDPRSFTASCLLPEEPFQLAWSPSEGAWAYLVSLFLANWAGDLVERGIVAPDPLELSGVSISQADTTLGFPADVGLFQRAELDQRIFLALRDGLPPDIDTRLVVAAADRNFVNSVRGGRFNPSGNVRISSIVGDAVGVFGSLVPLTIRSLGFEPETRPPPCPV